MSKSRTILAYRYDILLFFQCQLFDTPGKSKEKAITVLKSLQKALVAL